jgi:hypothetical protein
VNRQKTGTGSVTELTVNPSQNWQWSGPWDVDRREPPGSRWPAGPRAQPQPQAERTAARGSVPGVVLALHPVPALGAAPSGFGGRSVQSMHPPEGLRDLTASFVTDPLPVSLTVTLASFWTVHTLARVAIIGSDDRRALDRERNGQTRKESITSYRRQRQGTILTSAAAPRGGSNSAEWGVQFTGIRTKDGKCVAWAI